MRTRNYLREFKWSNFYCLRLFLRFNFLSFVVVVGLFGVCCGFFRCKICITTRMMAIFILFFAFCLLFLVISFYSFSFAFYFPFLNCYFIRIMCVSCLLLPQSMHFFSLSLPSFYCHFLYCCLFIFLKQFYFSFNTIQYMHTHTHFESVVSVVRS